MNNKRPLQIILKVTITIVLIAILAGQTRAQDNSLNQVKAMFDKYHSTTFHEKIFIHTDKDFYLAGEILWLKAYVTAAATGKQSNLSKVLYVELIDDAKKPALQTKIAVNNGAGNGSVFLPVSLKSGNYILRSYTSWMMNSDPEFFFEKRISILNSLAPDFSETTAKIDYDVQFFPEGGNLLAAVENRIAFRVTDQTGAGNKFRGTLVNNQNDTVARFNPHRYGIGNFFFTPVAGQTYRAVIHIQGENRPIVRNFIPVQTSGYGMRVQKAASGQLAVRIYADQVKVGPVYLFVHDREKVTVSERAVLSDGSVSFMIDQAKLNEGISHLTVFDGNLRPVAERLYFKRPQKTLAVKVAADKTEYESRSRVSLDISTLDKSLPSRTDLSVAVYKTDDLTETRSADIFSYQWLTSELKGNVEDPEYYLQNANPETDQGIDNLMLSHGWRRFQWNDVIAGKDQTISFIPEFEGHIINGKITDKRTGQPAKGIMTFLSVPSKRTQIYASRSDDAGKIRFYTKQLLGPGEIVVQTNLMTDSVYTIEIDNPFSILPSRSPIPAFKAPSVSQAMVEEHHISTQVQNAFVADKLTTFTALAVNEPPFYGKAEHFYKLDDFVRFKTTEEVLREYVPSVVIFRQRNNFNVVVDKKTVAGPVGSVPLLILDGVPIFDRGNKIIAYDQAKLERLEVSTKNSFLGDTSFNSIINFSSFKGNLDAFELDPRDYVRDYEGLQLERQFFSPVYETSTQKSSRLPDLRQLLFWSPDARTGSNGKRNLYFYTSDEPGKYVIVVQGLSENGNPGSSVSGFIVK